MNDEKKNSEQSDETDETNSLSLASTLGEALLESLQAKDQKNLEVFERYTHVLRSRIHMHGDDFRTRFVKGYKALVDELNNPSD